MSLSPNRAHKAAADTLRLVSPSASNVCDCNGVAADALASYRLMRPRHDAQRQRHPAALLRTRRPVRARSVQRVSRLLAAESYGSGEYKCAAAVCRVAPITCSKWTRSRARPACSPRTTAAAASKNARQRSACPTPEIDPFGTALRLVPVSFWVLFVAPL